MDILEGMFRAKTLSKGSMLLASAVVLAGLILKGTGKLPALSMNDVYGAAAALVGVWTPVYVSTVTDKVKGTQAKEQA